MKRRSLVAVGLLLYGLTVIYPLLRLIHWFDPNQVMLISFLVLLIHIVILPPYISRRVRSRINRTVAVALMTWYGLVFELFLVVFPLEFFRLVVPLPDNYWGLTAVVGWLVLAVVSVIGAQRLAIKRLYIPAPQGACGKVFVQISDVHIGTRKPKFLKRVLKKVAQLNPSALLITGDLVDSRNVDANDLATLANLDCPVFFCTGNHERYEHCEDIVKWLREHGVTVLRNETVDVDPFQIIGIDDGESANTLQVALNEIPRQEGRLKILLYHKPIEIDVAAEWGVHLMLCGHTHHGQIFPFGLVVRREFNPYRGTHTVGDMTVHISSGTGTTGPMLRLGTRNEITRVEFV